MLTNEKVTIKTHRQHERFTFVRQKTIKIAFFLTFSRVFNNILRNSKTLKIAFFLTFSQVFDNILQNSKTIKNAFFLTFLRVFDNILQNLTCPRSDRCAMAFTRQKYFTFPLATWQALVSIPEISHESDGINGMRNAD